MTKYIIIYIFLHLTGFTIVHAQNHCIDSGFANSFFIQNKSLYATLNLPTIDNGMIMTVAEDAPNNLNRYGMAKVSVNGSIEYTRIYNTKDLLQKFVITNLLQLKNGEYIIGGITSYEDQRKPIKIILLKLNSFGNIIWQKQLNNNYGSAAGEIVNLQNLQEGYNGDIVVLTKDKNVFNNQNIITRLNNNGIVIWSNAYFGSTLLIESSENYTNSDLKLNLWSVSFHNSTSCFVYNVGLTYLKLDYNTGLLTSSKTFCIAPSNAPVDIQQLFSKRWSGMVTKKINNGNTLVFIENQSNNGNLLINLFDSNYNFIKSTFFKLSEYGLSNEILPIFNYDVNSSNGEIVFNYYMRNSTQNYVYPYNFFIFLDSNLNFKKQFFLQENGQDTLWGRAIYLPNGELSFITNGKQALNPTLSAINYNNIVSGATSKALCNAIDTIHGTFIDHGLIYSDNNFQYDSIKSNVYTSADSSLFTISNFNILETTNCKIISICDSIKLTGPASVCLNKNDSITYSFYKNPQCLKGVLWSIDTAFATIRSSIKKSELNIKFKKEGRVILYLGLDGCHLKDSIIIDIKAPKTFINIIKDSLLCPGGKLTLNATRGFSSYQWQNITGTDSLIVNQPGLYKVTATDSCGNVFSDSIQINLIDTQFTLPPIAEICYYDTLTIPLPNSLINVNWQPIENVFRENNKLKFFPNLNTNYNLQAEFKNKCIVNKSFQLKVTNCPETVYFPNSFTPNNDGLNDIFKPIISKPLTQYYFAIYNRLGQKIFETNNQELGWDGNLKGIRQNTGSFIWICNYKFARKATQQKKGSFTLLR